MDEQDKKEVCNILDFFNFEHTTYCKGEVDFYTLFTENGKLEYQTLTEKLYIWSGIGMGCYVDDSSGENDGYGFEIKIQNELHLQGIVVALLYAPPKDTTPPCKEAYMFDVNIKGE